jgi:hypothetical protein
MKSGATDTRVSLYKAGQILSALQPPEIQHEIYANPVFTCNFFPSFFFIAWKELAASRFVRNSNFFVADAVCLNDVLFGVLRYGGDVV